MDKYWIKISNIEKGPLTFEDLLDYDLEASTPFWCYGLKEWINFCDSEIFAKYNREIQNRERNKLKKIKQLKKRSKWLKMLTYISLPIITIFSILYFQYKKNDFHSESLKEFNLRNRVKLITTHNVGQVPRFLEYYDINGKLKFYQNVSISQGVSFDNSFDVSLEVDNYLVAETTIDSISDSYIKEKLAQVNKFIYLNKKANFRNTNTNLDNIENVSETKNLELWIIDESGKKTEKRIYNGNGILQSFPTSYCIEMNQDKTLFLKCKDNNETHLNDTIYIEYLNNKKERTKAVEFYGNSRFYKVIGYFKDDLIVKNEIIDWDGKTWGFTIFDQDKFGNFISIDKFYDDSKTQHKDLFSGFGDVSKESHRQYSYVYDNRNNWIEKIEYEEGKELEYLKRTIEYYTFWEYLSDILKL